MCLISTTAQLFTNIQYNSNTDDEPRSGSRQEVTMTATNHNVVGIVTNYDDSDDSQRHKNRHKFAKW